MSFNFTSEEGVKMIKPLYDYEPNSIVSGISDTIFSGDKAELVDLTEFLDCHWCEVVTPVCILPMASKLTDYIKNYMGISPDTLIIPMHYAQHAQDVFMHTVTADGVASVAASFWVTALEVECIASFTPKAAVVSCIGKNGVGHAHGLSLNSALVAAIYRYAFKPRPPKSPMSAWRETAKKCEA
jgi:hypothetical protein